VFREQQVVDRFELVILKLCKRQEDNTFLKGWPGTGLPAFSLCLKVAIVGSPQQQTTDRNVSHSEVSALFPWQ
jgi:hypothetical protein